MSWYMECPPVAGAPAPHHCARSTSGSGGSYTVVCTPFAAPTTDLFIAHAMLKLPPRGEGRVPAELDFSFGLWIQLVSATQAGLRDATASPCQIGTNRK